MIYGSKYLFLANTIIANELSQGVDSRGCRRGLHKKRATQVQKDASNRAESFGTLHILLSQLLLLI